ncbi:MAG TPA: RNA methyltransferase [Candidatus Angelobacter sp.]|nr:RNA methyltransferase [Candidatus Angelobacter sp.]
MTDLRVILVQPSFEESIGFVARAMKNFGLSNLHIVNPIAILGPNGRMRGGHAQDVLDSIVEHSSLEGALEGLDLSVGTTAQKSYAASSLVRKPMTPKEFAKTVKSQKGSIGMVFGREGTGLTNAELARCDATLTIPASPEYQTLNLSHAAAIVFYELQNMSGDSSTDQLASEQVKRTILRFLSDSATRSGMEEYERSLLVRAFRNVLGRSALRHREGSLLAEALRRVSETLTLNNGRMNSEPRPTVSESEAESGDWAKESQVPTEGRAS